MKIIQEATRSDVTAAELGKLAGMDPGFAMRVLALVNSPAFGFGRVVRDTRQAVALIGIRSLRNLALGLMLTDMVPLNEGGRDLLAISIRRGVAARLIAEAMGLDNLDEFFTLGLFLEVGLLTWATEDVAQAAQVARSPASSRVLLERARGQQAHPMRGAELLSEMGLDELLIQAVRRHHDTKPSGAEALSRVAWAAERFAAVFEGGDLQVLNREAADAGARIGMSEAGCLEVLAAIPDAVDDTAKSFDRDVGPQPDLDTLMADAHKSLVQLNSHYEQMVRALERLLSQNEVLNKQLERLVNTDGLTGLANKRALVDHLTRDLARTDRAGSVLSIVMIDVDHFKRFNDTYGHQGGDNALKALAKVLGRDIRTSDIAARWGGEEFMLVLADTSSDGAMILADRLRKLVAKTVVQTDSGPARMSASFGVASVEGPGCKLRMDELVRAADQALYRAKENGRNRVESADVLPVLKRSA